MSIEKATSHRRDFTREWSAQERLTLFIDTYAETLPSDAFRAYIAIHSFAQKRKCDVQTTPKDLGCILHISELKARQALEDLHRTRIITIDSGDKPRRHYKGRIVLLSPAWWEDYRPDFGSNKGYVYLLKSGEHYKIGATRKPRPRQRRIAVDLPEPTEHVHEIETYQPFELEQFFHELFHPVRANGEWFSLADHHVQWIRSLQHLRLVDDEDHDNLLATAAQFKVISAP